MSLLSYKHAFVFLTATYRQSLLCSDRSLPWFSHSLRVHVRECVRACPPPETSLVLMSRVDILNELAKITDCSSHQRSLQPPEIIVINGFITPAFAIFERARARGERPMLLHTDRKTRSASYDCWAYFFFVCVWFVRSFVRSSDA